MKHTKLTTPAPGKADIVTRRAAILHLDIVGSTRQVVQNLIFAHHQIQQTYQRISKICRRNRGIPHELRGDAVVAEFRFAADALKAAVEIQTFNRLLVKNRFGKLIPSMRIGVSFGEVISGGNIINGLPVIRAQRLEQKAGVGQVVMDQYTRIQLGDDSNIHYELMGTCQLKGFDEAIQIYRLKLNSGTLSSGAVITTLSQVASSWVI